MTLHHKPLRVLIPFNASAKPYGMERAVIELFDSLRPGIEPEFLLSHRARRERLPILLEIEARVLGHSFFSDTEDWPRMGKPRSLKEAWKMCAALIKGNRDVFRRSRRSDAVYLCGVSYSFFSLLTSLYCLISGKQIVYQFHDLIERPSAALSLLRWVVRDFVHSTAIGFGTVTRFNPSILNRKNHIIPLIVKPRDDHDSDDWKDLPAETRRPILFVGQVSAHKGIDLLLQAMASIAGDYPDAVLVIVGECLPAFRAAFDGMLADPRLAGRVVCLGYRDDVLRYMAKAYVYVHPTPPSRCTESFGRGVLEAMTCGVPAISFRSGGLQELILHRRTGLLSDREDAGGLAECLRRFLDDPALRDECGSNARRRYDSAYHPRQIVAAWESLLSTDRTAMNFNPVSMARR